MPLCGTASIILFNITATGLRFPISSDTHSPVNLLFTSPIWDSSVVASNIGVITVVGAGVVTSGCVVVTSSITGVVLFFPHPKRLLAAKIVAIAITICFFILNSSLIYCYLLPNHALSSG